MIGFLWVLALMVMCCFSTRLFFQNSLIYLASTLALNMSSSIVVLWCRVGGVDVGGSRGEDSPDVSSSTHLDTDRLAPLGEMQMRLTV